MRIYISCPIAVNESVIENAIKRFDKLQIPDLKFHYWERGTVYNGDNLIKKRADAVAIILDSTYSTFTHSLDLLPAGVRSEVLFAKSLGIPLYIFYRRIGDHNVDLYKAEIMEYVSGSLILKGMPGTANQGLSNHLFDQIADVSGSMDDHKETITSVNHSYDKRILLTNEI